MGNYIAVYILDFIYLKFEKVFYGDLLLYVKGYLGVIIVCMIFFLGI